MKLCKVCLFLVLLAVCLPAVAQTRLRVDVPFNFMVAGKPLPAGQYMVTPAFSSDRNAWRICGDHDCATVLTNAEESTGTAHRPDLIFMRTSGGYALVQFWPTPHFGRDLAAPKVEHTLMAEGDKYVEIGAK